jgi:hypothetical protein
VKSIQNILSSAAGALPSRMAAKLVDATSAQLIGRPIIDYIDFFSGQPETAFDLFGRVLHFAENLYGCGQKKRNHFC